MHWLLSRLLALVDELLPQDLLASDLGSNMALLLDGVPDDEELHLLLLLLQGVSEALNGGQGLPLSRQLGRGLRKSWLLLG